MEIAVLNYACGEVEIYTNIPDEWEAEEIADYLHNELGLDEDDILRNVTNRSVRSCGILGRLLVSMYKKELSYGYCAGQDYPSEARLVRKLLRCK